MKNILMYLNIPWGFIKQRPQFMAEKLSQYFDVFVYYNKPYKQTYLVQTDATEEQVNLIERPKVPRKTKFLKQIDNVIQRLFLKRYIKRCDTVWIMHPDQYEILKTKIKNKRVVYDCMDDYSQFPHLAEREQYYLRNVEEELVKRADYTFYTSKTLQQRHKIRYKSIQKSYVINNGFEPIENIVEDSKVRGFLEGINGKKLIYIGAIAQWFDLELIQEVLNNNPDIHIVLFGPTDIELPNLERLHCFGKIPHSSIYTAMKYADVLMMPFKINSLIEAVDPIKVYEYIYSTKPILVPDYEEMKKFKDYVTIYRNAEDFNQQLAGLIEKADTYNLEVFKQTNTWEARARQICTILNNEGKVE